MKLPSIFDYLPDEAPQLFKYAEQKQEPIRLTPEVAKAGIRSALATAAGIGTGYAAGHLIGHGADALSQKLTGSPIPAHWAAPGGAALGGLLMVLKSLHDKEVKGVLRRAYENSKERSG